MDYLTDAEMAALNQSKLDRTTPFAIYNASQTQFSIARFYGGCTYQGKEYVYIPPFDALVRHDVMKFLGQMRKVKKASQENKQETLI